MLSAEISPLHSGSRAVNNGSAFALTLLGCTLGRRWWRELLAEFTEHTLFSL